jgi:hypothetical protein
MGFNLAGLRFRNVLEPRGGPVERIEAGHFSVRGRPWFQANAYLTESCAIGADSGLYGDADGTGADRCQVKAQHMAISEAMERWAHRTVIKSADAAKFGFDVDPSSNGMAAFPGLLARQARRGAYLEAIERFSIMSWWEGRITGHLISTNWPGVDAVAIHGPPGGITAVTFAKTKEGYAFGHAAGESIDRASEKAVIEMERHAQAVRYWRAENDDGKKPPGTLERRALFFSTDAGFAEVKKRIGVRPVSAPLPFELICDREIPGPWSHYSTVWRVAFRPPSQRFLSSDETYYYC